MSVSTARKNRMARSLDAISCLIQYSVMIAGLLFVLGIVNLHTANPTGPIDKAAPLHNSFLPAVPCRNRILW